jgi:hypothetical protein
MDSAALRCFAGLACVRFNYGYGMLVKEIHEFPNSLQPKNLRPVGRY